MNKIEPNSIELKRKEERTVCRMEQFKVSVLLKWSVLPSDITAVSDLGWLTTEVPL